MLDATIWSMLRAPSLLLRPSLALLAVPTWLALAACQKSDTGDADDAGNAGTTSTAGGSAGAASGAGGNQAPGGSAGAGASAGAKSDPCATAVYCDDFESYGATLAGPWTARTAAGSVTLDTTEHVSGAKSVRFSTEAASSVTAMMRLQGPGLLPVVGNVVYGRMLFKLAAAPTASVHWTMIQGLGVVPGQTYHAAYRYGGQMPVPSGNELMANYDTPDWYSNKSTPGSDCWRHASGRVIPVERWVCIEWKFDGPNAGMQLWLDGQATPDLTIAGHGDGCVNAAADFPWTAPSFTSIDLGWESYQADAPRTAWVDDVVISTTPIGCP
jgi:hypothetical protein